MKMHAYKRILMLCLAHMSLHTFSRNAAVEQGFLKVIRKNMVNKCMKFFNEITENKEDYLKFYEDHRSSIGSQYKISPHRRKHNLCSLVTQNKAFKFTQNKKQPK